MRFITYLLAGRDSLISWLLAATGGVLSYALPLIGMAATSAKSGAGTFLQAGDAASPEVFTTVAELTDINRIGVTAPTVDATHHSSPTTGLTNQLWEEKIVSGIVAAGMVSLRGNYLGTLADGGTQAKLFTDLKAGTLRNFKLILPQTNKTLYFSAYIARWDITPPLKNKQEISCDLDITGALLLS